MANKKILLAVIACIVITALLYYYFATEPQEFEPLDQDTNDMATNYYKYPFPTSTPPAVKNFKLTEFHCNDGTPVPVNHYGNVYELMKNLQVLRDHLGVPIIINSGYRTPSHNARNGGATGSRHLLSQAADIRAVGYTPKQVNTAIKNLIAAGKMRAGGLGSYKTFTHYDVRGYNARWTG